MAQGRQSVDLSGRVNAGLNKGEARNALARAVFPCRLGEIRDSSFEQQRYRASGLTLVTASIALWNTVYIERAVQASARNGNVIDPELLKYLSHSDGSTSISPAITSGRVKSQLKGDSGRSMHRIIVKGSLHHPRRIFPIPRSVN
jgi:Tn3 transposase DDE domain-containing protein